MRTSGAFATANDDNVTNLSMPYTFKQNHTGVVCRPGTEFPPVEMKNTEVSMFVRKREIKHQTRH